MSDEVFDKSDYQIPPGGRKIFRRKRKHRGEDWGQGTPPTLQDVHRGVWCRRCKKRHPYNGHAKLLARYEERSDGWWTMWLCPLYYHVVGERAPMLGKKDDDSAS